MTEHKSPQGVEVWAHRGASSLAPENTLAAGRAALARGAFGWEVDVRLTQDGVCVLLHDMGLLRTTDLGRKTNRRERLLLVTNFTSEEIRGCSAGSWFVRRDPFGTIAAGLISPRHLSAFPLETVPTLNEALTFTRRHNWRINLEIKDSYDSQNAIVRHVCYAIQAQNMMDAVIVSSFLAEHLARVREYCPTIPTAWLVRAIPPNIITLLKERDINGLHVHQNFADPETVQRLQAEGFAVRVYTVNQPKAMKRFIDHQVNGIITDYPHILAGMIQANSEGPAERP